MSIRKKNVFVMGGFFIVGIIILALVCNNLSYSYTLDEVRLKYDNKSNSNLAIFKEKEDESGYEPTDTFPENYQFNSEKSGCNDVLGNRIDGSIEYISATNSIKVVSKTTSYCYIYFDIIKPDIKLNLTTNGTTSSVPTSAKYTKSISCDTGSATYDTKYNRVVFSSVTSPVNCTLNYETDNTDYDTLIEVIQAEKTRTVVNDGICSKSEYTTKSTCESNSGMWWGVYDENGLRYEGLQPNNHVWFNNEIWRIIGYVPTKDADGNDTQLVKIIRNESIGGLTFNSSGSTYVGSRIYNILNTYYYGRQDGAKSGYCYGYNSYHKTQCNYESVGLNTISRNMIEPVQWAIGMQSSASDVGTHYVADVGTYTNTSGGINIGLMSASDYGYSVIDDDCERSTSLGSYDASSCAGKTWLYGQGDEWTMSPHSSSNLWTVSDIGYVEQVSVLDGLAVRPALYLDAGVYVISGSGTMADPYMIGI